MADVDSAVREAVVEALALDDDEVTPDVTLMEDLGPLMREAAAVASELIPGAAEAVRTLRGRGLKIASTWSRSRAPGRRR